MKRFTAKCVALTLALSCISVTACTNSTTGETTTANPTTAEATTTAAAETEATTTVADSTTTAELTVSLRIEGAADTYFYDTVTTTATNVLELMQEVDAAEESITFTIADGYLSAVNEEAAASFGGWDGWLYRVNDTEPGAMADTAVNDGDVIVLYYGDPYGVGMQYPQFACADGVVTVTSTDTTYDESGTPVSAENPVAGATVTWYTDGVPAEYVTDENGQFTLAGDSANAGEHIVSIEKNSEAGLPLVLRVAEDFTVTIE